MASNIFNESERFQKGRKLSRRLDDVAVARAKIKAMDSDHQSKFLSRTARERNLALKESD